jgi:uncharacterized RDD family membrane protein YckC
MTGLIWLTESDMEDAIAAEPEKFLGKSGLKLVARQYRVGRYVFGLLFEEAHGAKVIVEVQLGALDRYHTYKVSDYYDEYKEGHLGEFIEVMVAANRVPYTCRRRLRALGVSWREIPAESFIGDVPKRAAGEISKSYGFSIVVRRWGGAWIDLIVLGCLPFILSSVLGNLLHELAIALWLLLTILYFPLFEGLTGYSLGKLLTGTKVVDASGNPPGLWRATVRTLLRLFEVNPFIAGGLPAGIAVLLSEKHQRLGDMAAGTFVLREKDLAGLRVQ